jgi:hypothetical protein
MVLTYILPATRISITGVAGFLLLGSAIASALPAPASEAPCLPSHKSLFYSPHPLMDQRTMPGFSDSLRRQLTEPLGILGYCLQAVPDYRALLDTARLGDHLVLHALVTEGTQVTGSAGLVIAMLSVRDWAAGKLDEGVSRPLVSLNVNREDPAGLLDVLVKKVAENLRRQYVAHVLIQSRPGQAEVKSDNGLRGKTPVEWILPLGTLMVELDKPGFLPLERKLDLTVPGLHSFDLQLAKRRFYHSSFMWPALAFGAASLGAYALQEHYYARYQAYGPEDGRNRPEVFGKTFRTAKNWERISAGSLSLAGACLALSFRF